MRAITRYFAAGQALRSYRKDSWIMYKEEVNNAIASSLPIAIANCQCATAASAQKIAIGNDCSNGKLQSSLAMTQSAIARVLLFHNASMRGSMWLGL